MAKFLSHGNGKWRMVMENGNGKWKMEKQKKNIPRQSGNSTKTHRLRSMDKWKRWQPSPVLSITLQYSTIPYTLVYSPSSVIPFLYFFLSFPFFFIPPFSTGPGRGRIGNKGHLFAFLAKTEKGHGTAIRGREGGRENGWDK